LCTASRSGLNFVSAALMRTASVRTVWILPTSWRTKKRFCSS
jgi:hypothetical protein